MSVVTAVVLHRLTTAKLRLVPRKTKQNAFLSARVASLFCQNRCFLERVLSKNEKKVLKMKIRSIFFALTSCMTLKSAYFCIVLIKAIDCFT